MSTHILIIDDEPRWIQCARDDLGRTFQVEVAADSELALAKLKETSYDLIIASSRRLDVLEKIKEKYPGKRVVVATGQPTTHEAINTYRLGALDYFTKDFRREMISKRVSEALQKPSKASA